MEDFQEQKSLDTNIDHDLIENGIDIFKKSVGESTSSPFNNNQNKNSKLKICDLILIDNESNFLDLKIKIEINANKNYKAQISLKENVIKFTNFSETTNSILTRLEKDVSVYTISYFKENLEKITSEIDVNSYQGQTIYLKICERFNKRNNNNLNNFMSKSNGNLVVNVKNKHRRNLSYNDYFYFDNVAGKNNGNINYEISNNNNSIELSPTNSSEKKKNFNNINYDFASRINFNFSNHKSAKKENNLRDLIEENLNYNLALENKRSKSISMNSFNNTNKFFFNKYQNQNQNQKYKKLNQDLLNYNTNPFGRTMLLKREPVYFAKKIKINYSRNANKEKAYFDPMRNLLENKQANESNNDSNYFIQFKNKFKKEKLLKNEILFKNRKLISDQIKLYSGLENNNNKNIKGNLNDFKFKENNESISNNEVVFSTYKKKKIVIPKQKEIETENEKEENQILSSSERNLIKKTNKKINNSDYFKSNYDNKTILQEEKISSRNFTNFSKEEKNDFNIKLSYVDTFLSKKLDNTDSNKICNSDRKPVSLIAKFKRSFTKINQNTKKNKDKENEADKNTPYLLTNQSYSDRIKPKNQVDFKEINKINENKSSLTSENFYRKANNFKLISEKKTKASFRNNSNNNYKQNNFNSFRNKNEDNSNKNNISRNFNLNLNGNYAKLDSLEEDFFNKKITFNRNIHMNKFAYLANNNSDNSNSNQNKLNNEEEILKAKTNFSTSKHIPKDLIGGNKVFANNNFFNSEKTFSDKNISNNALKLRGASQERLSEININKTLTNKNLNSPNSKSNNLNKFEENKSDIKNPSIDKNNDYYTINNNKLLGSDKNFSFYQTFSNSKDSEKTNILKFLNSNKNFDNKSSRKTVSMNSTNFESLMPSLNFIKLDQEKHFLNKAEKNLPSYKQSGISNLLKIQEPPSDLDKTFSEYFENLEINDSDNNKIQNINQNNFQNKIANYRNNNNNFIFNSNNENTRLFNNPTLNNKISTTNLNCYSEDEISKNNKTTFIKENILSNRKQTKKAAADVLIKNDNKTNKSEIKSNNNNNKNNLSNKNFLQDANSIKSKYRPNMDKKTSDEVKSTRNQINSFITNNLNALITNSFIEENLKWLISNDNYKPKKQLNSNNTIEFPKEDYYYYHTSKLNLLNELKVKRSIIENYNENLISVETNPALENQEINSCEIQLAREFIFYNYLNCKALEKFYCKKVNKNEFNPAFTNSKNNFVAINDNNFSNTAINKSLNFLSNHHSDLKYSIKNLNYTNLSSTAANEQSWFNSACHNSALDFFNAKNNSKQISEYNFFINQILNKLKKNVSGFLQFLNFISVNKMNLQIKNFALDLIFVNLYIVDAKNKTIDEILVYLLIEFLANEKEKKLFFENYKKLKKLSGKKNDELETASTKDFYNSKFLFFKNFIKMVLKNSQDNVHFIKNSFDISDQEIYFILFSDLTELKQFIDDEDFKSKITSLFDSLIESL